MSYEEEMTAALLKVGSLRDGEEFVVKDLFDGVAWNRFEIGQRLNIGRNFKSRVESGQIPGVVLMGKRPNNSALILLCRLWARRRTPHRLNWATSRRSPCIGAFSGCALPDPTRTPPFPSCRGEGSSSPRRGRGSRRAWCGRTPCGSRGTGAADSRAG